MSAPPATNRLTRTSLPIPPQLAAAVVDDDSSARTDWLAALPERVGEIASAWNLQLGDPYLPGGQCAWVAPARTRDGEELVLKVAWRHREAEQEAAGLVHWDGDGAVRCYATRDLDDTTTSLLLERCVPGDRLATTLPEPQQDVIVAQLLHRLCARTPQPGHPFATLDTLSGEWADTFEAAYAQEDGGLDAGLAHAAVEILRTLAETTSTDVLLCTDLHAENILAANREPWLMVDPKPVVGDPAFDPVQHLLNCEQRLHTDPVGLTRRMAELLELEPQRVRLWLFARCVQDFVNDSATHDLVRRLAP